MFPLYCGNRFVQFIYRIGNNDSQPWGNPAFYSWHEVESFNYFLTPSPLTRYYLVRNLQNTVLSQNCYSLCHASSKNVNTEYIQLRKLYFFYINLSVCIKTYEWLTVIFNYFLAPSPMMVLCSENSTEHLNLEFKCSEF